MKRSTTITLLLAGTVFTILSNHVQAQDRSTISARAASNARAITAGTPIRQAWKRQVTTRARHDSFVYRSEGNATVRHDEVSSPEIIFHAVKGQRVRAGHVYHRRVK